MPSEVTHMARWEIKHDPVKDEIKLTYTGRDGKEQDCGTCEPCLETQLLEWLFSPGQLEDFDMLILKGREYFCQRNARC